MMGPEQRLVFIEPLTIRSIKCNNCVHSLSGWLLTKYTEKDKSYLRLALVEHVNIRQDSHSSIQPAHEHLLSRGMQLSMRIRKLINA